MCGRSIRNPWPHGAGDCSLKRRNIMEKKPFYISKTLWVNVLAIAGLIIESYTGHILSPEMQGMILGAVNIILRLVTKEEIVWK